MNKLTLLFPTVILAAFVMYGCGDNSPEDANSTYDLTIIGGTVIDPETGTNQILNVGIDGGTIVALTDQPLQGKTTIDAAGKTVSPGFIDLHTHSPFPFGEEFQARDGCTTALDLEAGAFPVSAYGSFLKEGAHANYGASVGHYAIRIKVLENRDQEYLVTRLGAILPGPAFTDLATPEQIEEIRKLLHEGIDRGGLGIGFLLDYMSPAISDEELRMIFEVAAERKVVVWAHIRRGINGDIQPLKDLLEVAQEIGTPLHICHINANSMGEISNWMALIDEANQSGADISMEVFPYTAGSTSISADVFDRDWQTIFGITYEDVQWAETGEFLTKETWEKMRKERPDGNIIHHYMKEEWLKTGMQHPEMIIATDAMPALNAKNKAAPNGAGSYTRLLARYVRELGVLTLEDAIAKGSYFPARRLESFAPAFAKKGRIQEGADADLLVFDLEDLQDNATYTDPYQESTGWSQIIVGGEIVFADGEATGAVPGKRMLATD